MNGNEQTTTDASETEPSTTAEGTTPEEDAEFDPVAVVRQINAEQGGLPRRQGLGG